MSASDSSQQVSAARALAAQGNKDAINLVAIMDNLRAPILDNFKKTGKKFTDDKLPPTRNSLINDWNTAEYDIQRSWKYFSWRRIEEIYHHPIKVFDSIEPNDIRQGALGNCYFLSALSALSEFPHRIQRCFDSQDFEPSGYYIVYMCDLGEIKPFIVDSFFPCNTLGKPCFSGPKVERGTSELWVILLEKAWAKRFGSYYTISDGYTNDALRDFTGAPCEDINTDNEHLWTELEHADNSNFIITAASGGSADQQDAVNSLGLVSLHAYSLIKVREFSGIKLMQIRNPWGGTEWSGDWSDNSPLWTDALKQELGWTAENDGTFWMSLEDFRKHFTSVTICRAYDNFRYKNVQSSQEEGGYKIFRVDVSAPTRTYVSVSQIDDRRFDKDSGYEYATVRIIGAFKDPVTGVLHYIGGRANTGLRDVWEQFECTQAGQYLFYIEIEWTTDATEKFGFSTYSSNEVSISDVTEAYLDFPNQVFNIETARKQGKVRELGPGITMYTCIRSGTDNDFKYMEGFVYDAFENTSTNSRLNLEINHKTLTNLEILPLGTRSVVKLSLGPGESAVVLKKQIDMLEGQSYSMGMKKQIVTV
jgi:calpain-15